MSTELDMSAMENCVCFNLRWVTRKVTQFFDAEMRRTVRETSTGLARDEPVHDFSSHACDALRVVAEAEMAQMLSGAGSTGTSARRQPVKVIFGFRGDAPDPEPDILDRFFGGLQRARVIR